MQLNPRKLNGVFEVIYKTIPDERGFLAKLFDERSYAEAGIIRPWKQILHSHTTRVNTVRGLYVQREPYTEGKLIVPYRGSFFWVAIDLRKGSQTFGQWDGMALSAESGVALYIERGFAHGFLSLSDNVDALLAADNSHSDEHGAGIAWNDPELAIQWPLLYPDPVISAAHARYPSFAEFRESYHGI